MRVSPHTVKTKRQEHIAKGIIYFFVAITLIVLGWIVFYIMYKGFYSVQYPTYEVTALAEEAVDLGLPNGKQMIIITNKKVRIDDITAEALNNCYTKRRQEDWGHYTEQNLDVVPFAFKPDTEFTREASEIILNGEEFGGYVAFVNSPEEMVERVANNKGAIGYIAAENRDLIRGNGVQLVPLRRISVGVHPSVKKIENNKQLQSIENPDLMSIFSGGVTNWNQIGGIDLPIRPFIVIPDRQNGTAYDTIYSNLLDSIEALGDNVTRLYSEEDLLNRLASVPGAVGLSFYSTFLGQEEIVLQDVRVKETGLNLDIYFIIEPPARSGAWGGVSTIIINTIVLILFTLLFSTPIGLFAAIYLVEYAKQGRMIRFLRVGTETLAGVPSIIFGLFGNIFFVNILGLGIGFISATLSVTMMILPTIVRTSEEALKSVPKSYREGSLALGANKLQTIFKVTLPAAIPGILTGIILGVGRVVGETAVLLYTLGSNYELVRSPSSSARVLSLHLYALFSEAISYDRAFATGAILVFIILIVNFSTTKLISRVNRMAGK
ncbi:MAG: phosphate ABC transporter permease PstA [Spirochaetia bacterium]